ncbi:unnamed protein product [Cuscuta europaea]|uniref:Uncharacterized protein n=1 Tax=Cuscuta europaea TaxID=41803 RepID=A0A9P1DYE4_CUSEU|nr:unnamed protein product [Cuscuta europaea]
MQFSVLWSAYHLWN